jgi:hypothetical protein
MPDQLIVHMAGTWVDIPGGWATVIVAFLTVIVSPAILAVVTARLSGRVKSVQADTAQARDQLTNSHKTNFREETDDRHDEIVTKLDTVLDTQRAQGRDIGGMKADIRRLADSDLEQNKQAARDRDRINDLERTIPRDELGRFMKREEANE